MLKMTIDSTGMVSWHKHFSLRPSSILAFIFTQFKSLDIMKGLFTIQNYSVRIKKKWFRCTTSWDQNCIFFTERYCLTCLHVWQKYLFAFFCKTKSNVTKIAWYMFFFYLHYNIRYKKQKSNKNFQIIKVQNLVWKIQKKNYMVSQILDNGGRHLTDMIYKTVWNLPPFIYLSS